MPDVTLPKLADTLVEGTVTRWLKRPGEHVTAGEPLVEVETDKVNSEIEAPYDGTLTEIVVPAGVTVPVGEVIARIGGDASDPAPSPPVEEVRTAGLQGMRRRIAERMQESRAAVSQGSVCLVADLSQVQRQGGWTAHFVAALAMAGGFDDVGVAVEVPAGLVVPVVRGAGRKTVAQLDLGVRELVERAREGRLAPADVVGGEITVTNVGSVGTLAAFPLVNPGQPAILAPGAVIEGRCWLTLCYDEKVMDEGAAADLLGRVAARLG